MYEKHIKKKIQICWSSFWNPSMTLVFSKKITCFKWRVWSIRPSKKVMHHHCTSMTGYLDLSENSGFSPQIIHFNRVFHYKPSILGYPYFWKHPLGSKLQKNTPAKRDQTFGLPTRTTTFPGTIVHSPTFGWICMVNVGKYTSPMDPMGFLGVSVPCKPSLAIVCWDWGHTRHASNFNSLWKTSSSLTVFQKLLNITWERGSKDRFVGLSTPTHKVCERLVIRALANK